MPAAAAAVAAGAGPTMRSNGPRGFELDGTKPTGGPSASGVVISDGVATIPDAVECVPQLVMPELLSAASSELPEYCCPRCCGKAAMLLEIRPPPPSSVLPPVRWRRGRETG